MNACANGMNDHRLIGWRKEPWLRFRPQEAALLHHRSKAYLTETLATPFDGPTVVITHHAPHRGSVHPRFRSDPVTGGFVSDLSGLIEAGQPELWVHGHVHNSSDYRVGTNPPDREPARLRVREPRLQWPAGGGGRPVTRPPPIGFTACVRCFDLSRVRVLPC